MTESTGTIYKMDHPTIEFESTNKLMVDMYTEILTIITAEDIRLNNVSNRHGLMINMAKVGDAPIAEEYKLVREYYNDKMQGLRESRVDPFTIKKLAYEYILKEFKWAILF